MMHFRFFNFLLGKGKIVLIRNIFLWKRESRQELSTSGFVVCMEIPVCVIAVLEYGRNNFSTETDIADQLRCGLTRTAATEPNKQNIDGLIRQDRRIAVRKIAAQHGMGHHAVHEMEFLDIGKFVPVGFPIWLRVQRNTKLLANAPCNIPYCLDLAPSDNYSLGTLKDRLRGHHYETDEAVQEAVRSWLQGAGTDFYSRGIFKFLQPLEEWIDGMEVLKESNKRCLDFTDNFLCIYLHFIL
jgi:hypothetical protein